MPTYQYACTECGHAFEQVQSFSEDSLTVCPQCQGRLRKVYNAVGVVFKGSGFYRNDSRSTSDSGSSSSSSSSDGGSDSSGGAGGSGGATEKSGGSEKKSGSTGAGKDAAPASKPAEKKSSGTSTSSSSSSS